MASGMIRGLVHSSSGGASRLEPTTSETFDAFISNLKRQNKFVFGSAAANDLGTTPVRNATELASYFDPFGQSADNIVINQEWQYYNSDFSGGNHVFASDALELTGLLPDGTLPAGVTTASPTSDVTYSRQVTVADASALNVGQVVGFGSEAFANLHRMHTYSITTPAAGDVITLVLSHVLTAAQGGFDPVTLNVTSAGVAADDAAAMVAAVNAHATLQTWNITALLMPNVPGGFLTSFPKYSLAAPDDFGNAGKGSIAWMTRTFSRTGTATVLNPQNVSGVNYIVSKSGNTLTLAHPVTLTTSSVLTFNPVYMIEVALTGQVKGVDRVVNGNFAADTDWTKGSGWSIAAGVASATTSSAALSQTIASIVAGATYSVTYTVTRSAGSVRPSLGGVNGTSRSTSATFTDNIVAGAGGVLAFTGTGFTGTIDVVSVKGYGTFAAPDASLFSAGQVVQCSFQDSNLRRITAVDTVNNELIVEGQPYMQAGHWLTAYPVVKALTSEASRTNLVLYNSSVATAGTLVGGQTDPNGASLAYVYTETATSTGQQWSTGASTIPYSNTTVYTCSAFVKAGTCDRVQMFVSSSVVSTSDGYANFYLNGAGSVSQKGAGFTSASIERLGATDWYRIIATFTATGTSTNTLAFSTLVTGLETRAPSFLGTSRTIYWFGPQVEVGSFVTSYIPTTTATSNLSKTLVFSSVPAGIAVGHRIIDYYGWALVGNIKVTAKDSTTVTLDTGVAVGNGATIQFSPPISSGQIWSKSIFAPGMDGRATVAFDFTFKAPDAAVIAAWPAFWMYSAYDDPNPTSGGSGSSEIDFADVFNYWNNASTNNYIGIEGSTQTGTMQAGSTSTTAVLATTSNAVDGDYVGMTLQTTGGTGNGQTRTITGYNGATRTATVSPAWTVTPDATTTYKFNAVDFYTHPNWSNGSLTGNNFGSIDRRLSCVMTSTKAFFYLDNVLIRASYATWNKYKRGQVGIDLAVGSAKTSFNANGFYPVDVSQFPMKFRVKTMTWWASA